MEEAVHFRISGLDPSPWRDLFGLSDEELRARGAIRYLADRSDAFPDRVELCDVDPGETVLLLNYVHQAADTPYRASHAVFIREGAERARVLHDEIPRSMLIRPLSLRAFDGDHLMVDGDVLDGRDAARVIERMLSIPEVAYVTRISQAGAATQPSSNAPEHWITVARMYKPTWSKAGAPVAVHPLTFSCPAAPGRMRYRPRRVGSSAG